jgi:hypothetical protein
VSGACSTNGGDELVKVISRKARGIEATGKNKVCG